jgi:thymidylate kinase
LWDKEVLKNYLKTEDTIFILGLSGNVFKMVELFDKVYYLDVSDDILLTRLTHKSRENPMGKTKEQQNIIFSYKKYVEEKAKEYGAIFIDANQSAEEIIKRLTSE